MSPARAGLVLVFAVGCGDPDLATSGEVTTVVVQKRKMLVGPQLGDDVAGCSSGLCDLPEPPLVTGRVVAPESPDPRLRGGSLGVVAAEAEVAAIGAAVELLRLHQGPVGAVLDQDALRRLGAECLSGCHFPTSSP